MNRLRLLCIFVQVLCCVCLEVVPDPYIINGNDVPEGVIYPFVVIQDEHGASFCGGTVVSKDTVLTAAHCIPDSHRVVLGARLSSDLFLGGGDVYTYWMRESFVHPEYDPSTLQNDIAIIKIHNEFPPGTPTAGLPSDVPAFVYIVGFGVTDTFQYSRPTSLQHARVDTMACPPHYYRNYGYLCHGSGECSSFCALGQDQWGRPIDACYGDSGGPAFSRASDGSFELYGVTSWGVECGLGRHYPGVYVKVAKYTGWIESHMDPPSRDECIKTIQEGEDVYSSKNSRFFRQDGITDHLDFFTWKLVENGHLHVPESICIST